MFRHRQIWGLFVAGFIFLLGCGDGDLPAGVIEGKARPESIGAEYGKAQALASRAVSERSTQDMPASKQILFGDLHVHTTYSIDAFVYSLALVGGEGSHPPADACDFARYCSGIDFFSINDHAEAITPELWQRTKESIRQCNAVAGDPANPDLVAFVGWEWTQVGATPETHYGHRNVILLGLDDEEIPARPITSLPDGSTDRALPSWAMRSLCGIASLGPEAYGDFMCWMQRMTGIPDCERGVHTRELPVDCRENATTAAELYRKLDEWDLDAIVIPHGLAWGIHAAPGFRMDNQLNRRDYDQERQLMIEIFSGHGNSEAYRPLPEFVVDSEGHRICPEPSADYLPCCWRAGEIMRERCGDLPKDECEARVEEAKRFALEAGVEPHRVFPDTRAEDWLDCDQCRNCFKPPMTLRPGLTAQYAAAISNFEEMDADGKPLRFRHGFIASSDNHFARAGTGYKQVRRRGMTDGMGPRSEFLENRLRPWVLGRQQDPQRAQAKPEEPQSLRSLFDAERVASFMYPGGLVAVHAGGRDRRAIWDALQRREVYATSGPRILLWFDLVNGPNGPVSMGSELEMAEVPRFEVRAVGSFVQLPGCPEIESGGLSAERRERLCLGECYHPSDVRHPITAIEVIRIRPQVEPGEDVARLIEDPWKRFECEPDPVGCVVQFEDPEFADSARDVLYYVRALQEETPAINGANLRVEFDAEGKPVRADPCFGSYRTEKLDDCLAPVQERAWSSPIYVDWSPSEPQPMPQPLPETEA